MKFFNHIVQELSKTAHPVKATGPFSAKIPCPFNNDEDTAVVSYTKFLPKDTMIVDVGSGETNDECLAAALVFQIQWIQGMNPIVACKDPTAELEQIVGVPLIRRAGGKTIQDYIKNLKDKYKIIIYNLTLGRKETIGTAPDEIELVFANWHAYAVVRRGGFTVRV